MRCTKCHRSRILPSMRADFPIQLSLLWCHCWLYIDKLSGVPWKSLLANAAEGKAFPKAAGSLSKTWRRWRRGGESKEEVWPVAYGMSRVGYICNLGDGSILVVWDLEMKWCPVFYWHCLREINRFHPSVFFGFGHYRNWSAAMLAQGDGHKSVFLYNNRLALMLRKWD